MIISKNICKTVLAVTLISLSTPVYTEEQRCTMVNSPLFEALLSRVPLKPKTRNTLEGIKKIVVSNNNLSIAGKTRQLGTNNQWTRFIPIRCKDTLVNEWSPCGEPNAKISLTRMSPSTISGTAQIPWGHGYNFAQVISVEYSCKAGKTTADTSAAKTTSKPTNTSKAATTPDYVRSVFNAYSLKKRKEIQSELKKDGFYTSLIDGLYGKNTRRAIAKFASENGYSVASERGVTTTISKVLEETTTEERKQVVVATTVNVTKTEPKVDTQSSTATTKPIPTTSNNSFQKWETAQTVAEAQRYVDEVQASIVMYMAIREVIDEQPPTMKGRVLGVVDNEISRLQTQKIRLQNLLTQRFTTPIKPSNANLQVSAFRASDTFPKVPFYIPGTNEIGETLVTPRVSSEGYLNYKFDFIDPVATYDKVRDSVLIPHDSVDELITGMGKIDEWTQVAQENGVNRRISKAAACIPTDACKVKKTGISSTELVFQVYEDGSTSGRVQINKGQFNVGYNMSVESTILLQAYLIYMRDLGSKEFSVGVMSDEELLELFD